MRYILFAYNATTNLLRQGHSLFLNIVLTRDRLTLLLVIISLHIFGFHGYLQEYAVLVKQLNFCRLCAGRLLFEMHG